MAKPFLDGLSAVLYSDKPNLSYASSSALILKDTLPQGILITVHPYKRYRPSYHLINTLPQQTAQPTRVSVTSDFVPDFDSCHIIPDGSKQFPPAPAGYINVPHVKFSPNGVSDVRCAHVLDPSLADTSNTLETTWHYTSSLPNGATSLHISSSAPGFSSGIYPQSGINPITKSTTSDFKPSSLAMRHIHVHISMLAMTRKPSSVSTSSSPSPQPSADQQNDQLVASLVKNMLHAGAFPWLVASHLDEIDYDNYSDYMSEGDFNVFCQSGVSPLTVAGILASQKTAHYDPAQHTTLPDKLLSAVASSLQSSQITHPSGIFSDWLESGIAETPQGGFVLESLTNPHGAVKTQVAVPLFVVMTFALARQFPKGQASPALLSDIRTLASFLNL